MGGDAAELGGVRRASSAQRLHADGRTLTVSVPPVYDGGQTDDSGYWVYDYGGIAPLVDTIRIMAYDYSILTEARARSPRSTG